MSDSGLITDVHQHLWPPALIEALRGRAAQPSLDQWRLSLSGEPDYDVLPADHDVDLRARQARGGRPGGLEGAAERAVAQASALGHTYVGTEHLLLALTAGPPRELARTTLADMGLTHERALLGTTTALSAYRYARDTLSFSGLSAPIRAALEDIRSRLVRLEDRWKGP